MTISSSTRKAGPYTGNGVTTSFSFSFKVFTAADLQVVKTDLAGVESNLVLGTDYTVTLNANQNSNPGGSITATSAPASGIKITITSDLAYTQPVDLTNQGGFYPDVINAALDRATIQIQQLNEQVGRSAKLPISNQTDADALSADIVRLAASANNIDIVANDKANVDAVAGNATNINTVAGSIASVNAVGTNIANVNAVAGNATNINAVNANSANINAVNANKTNIDAVAGNATNINAVNANKTNIDTVAGNNANITAVAGNATNINAVNANSANINTVAGNNTNVTTVATNIASVNSAASNMAAIIDAPNQAAAAASSAAAAAASAASGMYSAVQDKSTNYTVVAGDAGDLIRVNTSGGARTITLPQISGAGIGDGFKIAIVKWTADANAVTVARSGSDTINGATSYTIGNQYTSVTFVADAETAQWFAAASGLGTTNANVDTFSGNGSTVAFTLSGDPGTKNNTMVEVGGVYQNKATYSVSGTTITFTTAPPSGTGNIEVNWNSPLAIGTPSDDTVSTAKLQDGALAATAQGLAKMADGFLQATAAGLAKMADGFLAATTAGRAKMADQFVTYAKIQNVTAGKVLGRDTSGAGTVQELPLSFDSTGNVVGLGVTPGAVSSTYGQKVMQFGPVGAISSISASTTNNQTQLSSNLTDPLGSPKYINADAASALKLANGGFYWYSAAAGAAGAGAGLLTTMALNANGALALNGGNQSASGVGIAFPVTQSASSDANTLDDYEEGTWTPTNTAGIAFNIIRASYTKIGNRVCVTAYLTVASNSSGAAAEIGGAPFAAAHWGSATILSHGQATAALIRKISANTNFDIKTLTGDSALTFSQLSNTFLIFSLVYEAA